MRLKPHPAWMLAAWIGAGCGDDSGPAEATATLGGMRLHARQGGAFELSLDGRTLLSGLDRPVAAREEHPTAPLAFGQFDYDPGNVALARPSHLVAARAEGGSLVLALDGDGATATIRFTPAEGEITVLVHADAPALARRGLGLRFACDAAARFLGFGEQYQRVEHRGESFPLWVSEQGVGRDPSHPSPYSGNPYTTYYPVPFFLDPRGYGLAVDTDTRVTVDLCQTDPDAYTVLVDEPGDVTLHLYTGPTVADVMRAWTLRQGRSSAPPRWAVDGVWIGVQGGPATVLDRVARAKAANVPITAVWVQDWIGHLGIGGGSNELRYHWTLDETLYPDLPGLIAKLHGQGVRFLGYFNPFLVDKFGDDYKTAVAKGYAIRREDGTPYQFLIAVFDASMVDLTNPDAVTWFQGYAKAALAMGMDGWMDDFGEWLPYDAKIHAGDPAREHNLYPARWHKASMDVIDADKVIFSRSGWLGDAKTAQVVWAGDQETNWGKWDGLPTVVPAIVSLGLAGISYVTHDVAGFSSLEGMPSTKELYLRWTELAAFTPVFRTHEGLASERNWYWYSDDETLTAFSRFARVHAALAETFVKLGEEHARTGMPIVRALALGFPDDDRAVTTSDEYTIGTDMLVAPVLTKGATTRAVYFPKGHWIDVWDSGKSYDGPKEVTVDAPLGRPPVFTLSGRGDLRDIH